MCVALARFVRRNGQFLAGLVSVFAALGADAATFLVGTGPGCNFSTIQAGINAAAANPGPDTVRISNATTWGPGGVAIGQQDITIDGRYATCTDVVANGNYAQIVGNATNPDARPAMISITGSGVRHLLGLQIRDNVRGVNSFGGAISYIGTGEVILGEMDLRDNRADVGGAIAVRNGVLTLTDGVLIENNIADRTGGGLIISSDSDTSGAALYAVGASVSIVGNEAYGIGGGLVVSGRASAYIASTGLGGRAVLQANRAGISFSAADGGRGGAIAVIDGVGAQPGARVVVFSTNPDSPTRIVDNRAALKGGGVYLEPFFGNVSACILDTNLAGNRASSGAAVYADADRAPAPDNPGRSRVLFNVPTADACAVPAGAPAQPTRCARTATGCNVVQGHVTQTAAGMATPGAVVFLGENAQLHIRNARLVANTVGSLIASVDAGRAEINTALFAGNSLSASAVRLGFAADDQGFVMRNVTITDNVIPSANSIVRLDDTPASVDFNNNLIIQPARTALTAPFAIANGGGYNWAYNATSAPQVLPDPSQLVLADARFENAAFGDYRLRIGSRAVNTFAAGAALDAPLDLDGRSRPITLSILAPDASNDDVGAYERQESDPWLVNGSFSAATQLRYWEPSANGEAIAGVVWDPQDAAGNPNSGSALVNLPLSLASRLTVLRRCFNVPAPGLYTITAKAQRGSGLNADNALLSWRFRVNDESCSSAGVQGAGEVAFVTGDGFRPLAAPLLLDLPSVTTNSTIEIRLDAVSGLNLNGLTNVRFDDVAITGEPLRPEDIFANGFE